MTKKNYRTFQRVKYTEDFGFPLILDMEPYLEENLQEQTTRTAEDDKLIEEENKEAEKKQKRLAEAKRKVKWRADWSMVLCFVVCFVFHFLFFCFIYFDFFV